MIEVPLTPTFITFEDSQGRFWKALALIGTLKAECMDPVALSETEDLQLKIRKIKIVRE
jgi:hypothetical protein